MDFSQLNFVSSCEETTQYNYATSTLDTTVKDTYCYNPAISLLMIVFVVALFFLAMFVGYKLFSEKKLPV